jgi:hypothetical protein
MAAFANGAETVNASLNLLKTKARLDQRGATCDDRNIAADGPKRVVTLARSGWARRLVESEDFRQDTSAARRVSRL